LSSITRLRDPPRKKRKEIPREFLNEIIPSTPPEEDVFKTQSNLDTLWSVFEQPPGSHLRSTSKPEVWSPTPPSDLHAFIEYHSDSSHPLLSFDTPTLPLFISTHLLAPLLSHSTLVSTSLVSLYLDDLRFLVHLDVLRAFWLGGDVGLAERVSGSLFGKDEAGAGEALGLGRRARTRVRLGLGGPDAGSGDGDWGIGLALGLSDRQRWPPGGAELVYALRTTLVDERNGVYEEKGPVWEGIEDRISFAVEALPEDEADGRRARWMDPQAIE